MGHTKSKHEYNKPQLKNQIEEAMAAFLKSGRSVERVPTVVAAEAPSTHNDTKSDSSADDEEIAEAPEAPEAPDASL